MTPAHLPAASQDTQAWRWRRVVTWRRAEWVRMEKTITASSEKLQKCLLEIMVTHPSKTQESWGGLDSWCHLPSMLSQWTYHPDTNLVVPGCCYLWAWEGVWVSENFFLSVYILQKKHLSPWKVMDVAMTVSGLDIPFTCWCSIATVVIYS